MFGALRYTIDENSVLAWQEDYVHFSDADMSDADIVEDYGHVLAWVTDINNNITAENIMNIEGYAVPYDGYIILNYKEKYTYNGTDVVKCPPFLSIFNYYSLNLEDSVQ